MGYQGRNIADLGQSGRMTSVDYADVDQTKVHSVDPTEARRMRVK
jgi:hypothetical protein